MRSRDRSKRKYIRRMSEKFLTVECFPGRSLSRGDSNKSVKKKKKRREWSRESAWIPHLGNVGTEEPNHLKKMKEKRVSVCVCV